MERFTSPAEGKTFGQGKTINGYSICYLIGMGGFGSVYKVTDKKTHQMFAMKTESVNARKKALDREIECLKGIKGNGFPRLRTDGTYKEWRYLVMNMYGASVQAVWRHKGRKLGLDIALPIGKCMISILEQFHSQGWIHRDVKPSNFLLQQSPTMPVVLIDFGLCKRYIDAETGKLYPPENDAKFTGTRKYASMNAHNKMDLARRDDVISWFYSMVEMIKGALPWSRVVAEDVPNAKASISGEELCSDMPHQFFDIWESIKNLEYETKPDYEFIISKLDEMITEAQIAEPDWSTFYAQNSNLGDLRKSMDMSSHRMSTTQRNGNTEAPGAGNCCSVQ